MESREIKRDSNLDRRIQATESLKFHLGHGYGQIFCIEVGLEYRILYQSK